MEKYKLIACEVLRDEIEYLLAAAPPDRVYCVDWVEMGLHDEPNTLHRELDNRIRACAGEKYAAILLSFGLCSRATAELSPPEDSLLMIPKVHDCIALHLGSDARFQEEHGKVAGTFYFSRGFLHGRGERREFTGLGAAGNFVTDQDGNRRTPEEIRQQFIEEYGEDNAKYLMETLVESWKKNYTRAALLDWPENRHRDADEMYVKQYAVENNWEFVTLPMDLRLLKNLLNGPWPEDEFLSVRPGEQSVATNDNCVMTTSKQLSDRRA